MPPSTQSTLTIERKHDAVVTVAGKRSECDHQLSNMINLHRSKTHANLVLFPSTYCFEHIQKLSEYRTHNVDVIIVH